MAFMNRIRLPLYATRAQFPTKRSVFEKADGSIVVQSAMIRKQYEIETDYLPEPLHERFVIALMHDHVNIEGERYFGGISVDGEYEIEWIEFLDFPWAKAKVKVSVTPYNMLNSNCQTCDEASQIHLTDDVFPSTLEENTEYTLSVFDNDIINCLPVTAQLTYINGAYVESASITNEGILTLTTKSLLTPFTLKKMVTYRVTCPSGVFDDGDVYANLNGGVEIGCLQPASLEQTGDILADGATLTWGAPVSGPPADGYEWKYALETSPATIEETGTTASTTVTLPVDSNLLLEPNTTYLFSVRAICDLGAEEYSEWLDVTFITAAQENICGRYNIQAFGVIGSKNVTYMACNGLMTTIKLQPFKKRKICALQNSPGNPVSIIGADLIQYIQEC